MKLSYLLCLFPIILHVGCSTTMPELGIKEGKLFDCPSSPNCVSSFAQDKKHSIDPLILNDLDADRSKLKRITDELGGFQLVKDDRTYLHFVFTSTLLRFKDDVEFLFDERENIIHVRSASRVGRSDFGANRKRIEQIREKW